MTESTLMNGSFLRKDRPSRWTWRENVEKSSTHFDKFKCKPERRGKKRMGDRLLERSGNFQFQIQTDGQQREQRI